MTYSGGSSPANHSSAPPRKRFTLKGRSAKLDRHVDAVRPDLADVALADRVFAPHYAQAIRCTIAVNAPMMASPKPAAEAIADLVAGESFDLFDISGGWAWGRSAAAMGYVRSDAIALP